MGDHAGHGAAPRLVWHDGALIRALAGEREPAHEAAEGHPPERAGVLGGGSGIGALESVHELLGIGCLLLLLLWERLRRGTLREGRTAGEIPGGGAGEGGRRRGIVTVSGAGDGGRLVLLGNAAAAAGEDVGHPAPAPIARHGCVGRK